MTPLVIVGAGGFARETVELVRTVNQAVPTYDLIGYLDDNADLHGTSLLGLNVIGPLDQLAELSDAAVVVCLGSPQSITLRQRVVERIALEPDRFATLVHPSAAIASSVSLGPGSVVHAGCVFTADITIGAHVEIMPGVIMTHGDRVGDFATFGAGVRLAGDVTIKPSAYIGSGALVREQLTVGSAALIGMGSVVTRSVPAGEVWAGSPARRMHSTKQREAAL